nr:hypothetical protein [Desulfobacula sp.]
MEPKLEQRVWPRHQIEIPISLKCSHARICSREWHVGETRDISVDGMGVVSSVLKEIRLASMVEILCFPQNREGDMQIRDPEPVSMTGIVIWQDMWSGAAGIRLNN